MILGMDDKKIIYSFNNNKAMMQIPSKNPKSPMRLTIKAFLPAIMKFC